MQKQHKRPKSKWNDSEKGERTFAKRNNLKRKKGEDRFDARLILMEREN